MRIDQIKVGDLFKFQVLETTNYIKPAGQPEYVELVYKDNHIIVYKWGDVYYAHTYLRQISLDSFQIKPHMIEFFTVLSIKEHGDECRLNATYPVQKPYECELMIDKLIDYDDVLQVMKARVYQDPESDIFRIEILSTRVK